MFIMKNCYIWLNKINIVSIIAYLLTYAVVFCAFDDTSALCGECDAFETNYFFMMVIMGVAFTLTVIEYLIMKKKSKAVAGMVGIVNGILQIVLLGYAISFSERIISHCIGDRTYDEVFAGFCCDAAIVMSYIIIILMVISILVSLCSFTSAIIEKKEKSSKEWVYRPDYRELSHIHVPVIMMLMGVVEFCIVYVYPIAGILLFNVAMLFAFPLPVAILLSTVVKEWIRDKRYIRAAVAYVVYMYLAYGAIYRMFNRGILHLSDNYGSMEIVFDGFLQLLVILPAAMVVIWLIVKLCSEKSKN